MDLENFPTRQTAKDMMDMISPIYDNSYVGKWIFEVMSVPLEKARNIVDELQDQVSPETATWSLPYWEESYGIITNESLSIEERRSAIIRKRNFRKPMNPARIEMLLSELCGRDVELVENVAPHTFEIKISPGTSNVDLKRAIDLLYEIKQSQKSFRIVFETAVTVKIRAEPIRRSFKYRMASANHKTGTYPETSTIGKVSNVDILAKADEEKKVFPYVLAGTKPERANVASIASLQLQAAIQGEETIFPYPMTGTKPETSVLGESEKGGVSTTVEGHAASVVYKICGAKRL